MEVKRREGQGERERGKSRRNEENKMRKKREKKKRERKKGRKERRRGTGTNIAQGAEPEGKEPKTALREVGFLIL